ncbi:diguanylate cyclase [Bacillus tianshenii]|nr:diguanylate cyclase [Bacillus tianshenii]
MMRPVKETQVKIEQLKSMFFDLIANGYYGTDRAAFLNAFVVQLKDFLSVEHIGVYSYNKWKEQFYLEDSTFQETEEIIQRVEKEDWLKLIQQNVDTAVYNGAMLQPLLSDKYQIAAVPFRKVNADIYKGILFFFYDRHENLEEKGCFLEAAADECAKLFDHWKRNNSFLNDEDRYEQLYRVTAKFHSSMNTKDVLREIIITLEKVYPSFEHYLLMSQDTEEFEELPVRGLQYNGETVSQAAIQAYLTGNVQFEDKLKSNQSLLYVPLKGKQGIYGVLQVLAPNAVMFTKQEVDFVELLANTAGNALENAQLYQQSKQLIHDLRLINKTSHRLNSNLRLSDTVQFMKEQIIDSFGAQEVGFFMFPNKADAHLLEGSTDYFQTSEAQKLLQTAVKKLKKAKDSLFVSDLEGNKQFACLEYRSLLVVPMIQSGELKGGVIALHSSPYHFTFEKFKLLESLVHHSTLAFVNSMLREKLEQMVVTDYLTGLYSRNYLDDHIQKAMNEDGQGTFIMIDIDNFKSVNDTFGHQVGDNVIVQVAKILTKNTRSDDIASRWGGEELAVYLPRVPLDKGILVGERLVKCVREHTEPKITISCGISHWSKDREDSVKYLFNRADEALYEAKHNGKNQVVVHEDDR